MTPGSGAAPAGDGGRVPDQVPARSAPGYFGAPTVAERCGYVLLDVTSGAPQAWAAEVNACPPMTPWGPLRVAVTALVGVAS